MTIKDEVERGKMLGMKYQQARKLEEATIKTERILLNQMSRYYGTQASNL